jgi:hypothetical protein
MSKHLDSLDRAWDKAIKYKQDAEAKYGKGNAGKDPNYRAIVKDQAASHDGRKDEVKRLG